MVVGHAGEQAHFIEFHIMGDLEIVHVGADPAGDAGEAVASGAADSIALRSLGEYMKNSEAWMSPLLPPSLWSRS